MDVDLDDGVGEMLQSIENFMETYKKHASENIIDHTRTLSNF